MCDLIQYVVLDLAVWAYISMMLYDMLFSASLINDVLCEMYFEHHMLLVFDNQITQISL